MAATTATFEQLLEDHLERREARVKGKTLENEASACRTFVRWCEDRRITPRALTVEHMDDFLHGKGGLTYWSTNSDKKVLKTTYNKQLTRLTNFIKWLVMRKGLLRPEILGCIEDAKHRGAKPRPMIRLSLAQITELVEGCEDPYEQFVLAAYAYTAGRESELLNRMMVHIGQDERIDWYRSKTEEADRIPILPELEESLRAWLTHYTTLVGELQGNWHLVPARARVARGQRWRYYPMRKPSTSAITGIVKKNLARVLKIDDPEDALLGQGCHVLRRSAALAMYKALIAAGHMDAIRIVMSWLGHQKQETTEIYLGLESGRERRDEVLMSGKRWMTPDSGNVISLRGLRDSA